MMASLQLIGPATLQEYIPVRYTTLCVRPSGWAARA